MSSHTSVDARQAALSVNGLWWRYPTFSEQLNPWTLRGIDLQIARGECFGITGPSGAGKTTLCRAILGAIPYSSRLLPEQLPQHFRGTVTTLGEVVTAKTTATNRVGMVLQDPENQFLRMSLLHELALGLQIQALPNAEILSRAYDALCRVGLAELWHGAGYIHPADLSGGQKQRVAIAAFLAMRPQILLLDEPTSDLDPSGKREVIETIARLREEYDMTVVLVEQDPEILMAFCDRVALLHQGRIEHVAAPADFYAERQLLESSGASVGELTRISWLTGLTYQSRPPLNIEQAAQAFGPHIIRSFKADEQPLLTTEAIVQVEDVCYSYEDGTEALRGINLTVQRGEMLALLGPNGSGKTTLAKILAGIYRPARGRVRILGEDLSQRKVRARLPTKVGYVFQNPDHQLFRRKVSDEVEYGLLNLGIAPEDRRKAVASALAAVDLAEYAEQDPLFLGKGQRQRLAVASVLAMGPEIIIVDEPTTGQDYRMVVGIMALLRELQRQGKTILVITHDMSIVAQHCQRVITFRAGKVVFNGTPLALFESEEMMDKAGLRPPTSAALSTSIRAQTPESPFLITVEQWAQALGQG